MDIQQSLIETPDGRVVFNVTEDGTSAALEARETREFTDGFDKERLSRHILEVPPRLYAMWNDREPGCWKDKNFIRSFMREYPQYCTVRGGSV